MRHSCGYSFQSQSKRSTYNSKFAMPEERLIVGQDGRD